MGMQSRRDFLKASVASGVLAGFSSPSSIHAAGKYGDFRIGLVGSLNVYSTLRKMLKMTEDLGLGFLEINGSQLDVHGFGFDGDEINKRISDSGVQCDVYSGIIYSGGRRGGNSIGTIVTGAWDKMAAVGVRTLVARVKQGMIAPMDEALARYDIKLAVQNNGMTKPEEMLKAIEGTSSRVGTCVVTGEYLKAGVDPVEAVKMLKGRIHSVRISDYNASNQETVAGEGRLDLAGLFAELARQKYTGPCGLLYRSEERNGGQNKEIPRDGYSKGLANISAAIG